MHYSLYSSAPRPCVVCGQILTPRDGEYASQFARRETCGIPCGRKLAGLNRRIAVTTKGAHIQRRLTLVRESKPCAICGVTMIRPKGMSRSAFRRRDSCGPVCGQILARQRHPGRPILPRIEKACLNCGLIFAQPADCPPSRFKRKQTCSPECARELGAKRSRERVDDRRKPCAVCGIEMRRRPNEAAIEFTRRTTCSPHCRATRGNLTRHVTFVYASPYPPDWRQIRARIRERDGHRCLLCDAVRFLHVHHIDYQPVNCDDTNLITLCRNCHTKTTNGDRFEWMAICRAALAACGIIEVVS
jgi:5-methylcytosine-specific restriction endonuclease McrA